MESVYFRKRLFFTNKLNSFHLLDKEKFLEELEDLTGDKRQEILTPGEKSASFGIDTEEQANRVYEMIQEYI